MSTLSSGIFGQFQLWPFIVSLSVRIGLTNHLFYVFVFSYCGAQIFEIYGLGNDAVDLAFCGSVSYIGGLTLDEVRKTKLLKLIVFAIGTIY